MPINFKGPVYHAVTDPSTVLGPNFEFNMLGGTPVGQVDDSQFWFMRRSQYVVTADIPLTNNTTSWTLVQSAAGVYSLSDAGFPPYLSFGTNAANSASASATFGQTGMAGFTAPGTTIANGQDPKLYYAEFILDPHTLSNTSLWFVGFSDGGTSGMWAATNWVGVTNLATVATTIQPTVGIGASAGTFNGAGNRVGTTFTVASGTFYIIRILMSWSNWAAFSISAPATAVPTSPPFYQPEDSQFNAPIKIGTYQHTKLGFATTLPTSASVAFAPAYGVKNGAGIASSQNLRLAQITVGRQW